MATLSERHEVKIRGQDKTIVFSANSEDGRLVIRQEPDSRKSKEVCSITLANPEELRVFFQGLRRIVASLEGVKDVVEDRPSTASERPGAIGKRGDGEERDAVIAQAREKNSQAFAPWSRTEEQEIKKEFEQGQSVQQIARTHKRSPRAIELRLQRFGVLPS